MHPDDELMRSLQALATLLSGPVTLEDTLVQVAKLAVQAVPGAEGAGLIALEQHHADIVVTTADFVRQVDDIQYALREGPSVTAVADREAQRSGNLGGSVRWPHFGPGAGRLGVHSALSLPLLLADRVVGALNVYARAKEAFDDDAMRIGVAFAAPAAVSVANAQLLAQAERLAAGLTTALSSRAEIDQAIGVLMSRSGLPAEGAFGMLRARSQARGMKVTDLAHEILDESVRRARAAHQGTQP